MDFPTSIVLITLSIVSVTSLIISLRAHKTSTNIIRLLENYPHVFERLAKIVESKKKIRKRYIVIRVISQDKITRKKLDKAIKDTIKDIIGVKGLADTNYTLIDYDEQLNLGIIRSNSKAYKILIGLLGMVRTVDNNIRVLIIPISTHGTIRKAREKIKSLSKH